MTKRIIAVILALMFVMGLVGCNNSTPSQSGGEQVKAATFEKGSPKPSGDNFQVPKFEQSNKSLIIAEISKGAKPDDSVLIAGEGFSAPDTKAYVYSASSGKFEQAKFTVSNDTMASIVIDKDYKYGVYAVYLENAQGKSNIQYVNRPAIWNLGFTTLTSGDTVDIYGENLTTDFGDKAKVYLIKGESYWEAEATYADPFKISFTMPYGLEDEEKYEVLVHSGHGGALGFAKASEQIIYKKVDPNAKTGKIIDVTKFGADPKNAANDDSEAIQAAFDSAKDGDIVYFPYGIYYCTKSINVIAKVRICGDGKDNTFLIPGNRIVATEGLLNVAIGSVEVCDLGFKYIKSSGTLKTGFIRTKDLHGYTGTYNLYVHDCDFYQYCPPTARSYIPMLYTTGISGLVIENNTFDGTQLCGGTNNYKNFIRNNEYLGSFYSGAYYGQNWMIFTNGTQLDISGNKAYGKDYLDDDSGKLDTNDFCFGRGVVLQGIGRNIYIARNHLERCGNVLAGAGELILLETLAAVYDDYIVSATANTITIKDDKNYGVMPKDCLSIIDGKGIGQDAQVLSVSGNVITLTEDLKIVPDSTSYMNIDRAFVNFVAYKNYFNGHTNYRQLPGGTTGIQVYGGTHNLFYIENEGENLPQGICITPMYTDFANSVIGAVYYSIYWCQFDGNKFTNCGVGIRYNMTLNTSSSKNFSCAVGIAIRRNHFKDIPDFDHPEWLNTEGGRGINMSHPPKKSGYTKVQGKWLNTTLIENNIFENIEYYDITFNSKSYHTLLRNNVNPAGELNTIVNDVGSEPIEIK